MTINLHIDRLILNGLSISASDQAVAGSALVSDLTRRLQQEGLGQNSGTGQALARIRTAPIQVSGTPDGQALGLQIAKVVHRGISQ